MKLKRGQIIFASLALVIVLVAYLWISGYLKGASANCVDRETKRMNINQELVAIWLRRSCGMLYGGPYTAVKIKSSTLPYSLLGDVEVIEIEDEHGNFMPTIEMRGRVVIIGQVPSYLTFKPANYIFGREIVVQPN